MARVRRVIRKWKRLRCTKHHNVETLLLFEPAFQKKSVDQPPVQINAVNQPPVQINAVNQPPVQINDINQPPVQTNDVNQPPVKLEQAHRKPFTDYVSLAIKAAKALNQKTSLDHVDKVAKDLFKFDIDPHLNITMPDIVAQEIFDWIITLSEQPIYEKERLRLARKFIVSLAPISSPVEKPAAL